MRLSYCVQDREKDFFTTTLGDFMSLPNEQSVVEACSAEIDQLAEDMQRSADASGKASKLQELSRHAVVRLLHILNNQIATFYDDAGNLLDGADTSAIYGILCRVYSIAVDRTRELGYSAYKAGVKAGTIDKSNYTKTEMGKSASKGIRNKRRNFSHFAHSATHETAKFREDTALAVSPYVDGEANMQWGARTTAFKQPITHELSTSTMKVCVGKGKVVQEDGSLGTTSMLYLLGEEGNTLETDREDGRFIVTFGVTPNTYQVAMKRSDISTSTLFADLTGKKLEISRYLTQVAIALKALEDSELPPECEVKYRKPVEKGEEEDIG